MADDIVSKAVRMGITLCTLTTGWFEWSLSFICEYGIVPIDYRFHI